MIILVVTLLILIYFIVETIYTDYFKFRRENLKEVNQIEDFISKHHAEISELSKHYHSRFNCPTCGSKRADCNVISFSGKEYSQFSKKRPHKFIKQTCMGCGISSFYNLNLIWALDGLDPLPIDDPIYDRFNHLANHYGCRECKNGHAIAKLLTVRKKGLRHRLRPQPSEIICLSCLQCHLSSFYDIEITEKQFSHA